MYDLASLSLQPPASFPELYQELWWYSGSDVGNSGITVVFLQKGTTSLVSASTGSAVKLYTLNANWNPSNKYCLELALWTNNAAYQANAQLYDITAGSAVSGSSVSTTSTTATVLRSGQCTLIPGHTYGVQIWNSQSSGITYCTDASLIIFPPAGSVSPSLSSISLANPSGGTLKDVYIPLYVMSSSAGAESSFTSSSSLSCAGKGLGGATSSNTSATNSPAHLHTLNANWSPSQKFAFEASLYNTGSGQTAYACLYDYTSSTIITASQVSVSSTTATVIRSGSFTLTPPHTLCVVIWSSSGSYYTCLNKAHLIALGG